MDTAEILTRPTTAAASPTAPDRVYEYTKAGILSRRYADHDLLTEGELAIAVGVSRTPVREALLRLQAEGLVRLLPKRGALVLPVTPAEVADVLETRRLVEGHAVRRAVTSARPALVTELRDLLGVMRSAMRARDARAYVEADREFHERIVAATGNAILIALYRSLRDRQLRMGVTNLLDPSHATVDVARMRSTLVEHEAILGAIEARTIRAAESAVSAHLDRAEQHLRRS